MLISTWWPRAVPEKLHLADASVVERFESGETVVKQVTIPICGVLVLLLTYPDGNFSDSPCSNDGVTVGY